MCMSQVILGEKVPRPTTMDQGLALKILDCQDDNSFRTALGGTMCTDDFYEGIYIHTCTHTYTYIHI